MNIAVVCSLHLDVEQYKKYCQKKRHFKPNAIPYK